MFMLCSIARAKLQPSRFDLWTGVSEASLSTDQAQNKQPKGRSCEAPPLVFGDDGELAKRLLPSGVQFLRWRRLVLLCRVREFQAR
jgi:hypothetical protein